MAKALQITARPAKGFRRCGVHHPATPTLHAIDKFDAKQIKALMEEPQLVVTEVDVKKSSAEGDDGETAAGKGANK